MKQAVYEALKAVFSSAPYVANDGQTLLRTQIAADARACKPELIERLLGNDKVREAFFVEAGGATIFKADDFVRLLLGHEFLPSSFTSHANRIGLAVGGKYLKTIDDVVLDFPFKDCVLAGGQSRDEDARQELFYHEVMARDEISCLLEKKVLSNPVRVTKDGESPCDDFQDSDNLLIRGNNLVALHSLKQRYAGKVKLIYIDPPYNTGTDSFKYNDSFNHSTWLTFMRNRLEIAKQLLRRDGCIFIQIDDTEQAYLKVLMDEVFGIDNFINTISVNMKNVAGASGGGEDKKLKKNIEYIHIYAKDYTSLKPFTDVYDYAPLIEMVEQYRQNEVSWKYTSVLHDKGEQEYLATTYDGAGDEIRIFRRNNPVFKSISKVMSDEGISEEEAYNKYADRIFQTAMPQSSIRPRVMEKVSELGDKGDFYSIEYVPRSGKNKGVIYEQFYKGDNFRLLAWLKDVSEVIDGVLCKKEKQGTYWNLVSETKNLTKEGSVELLSGKKPEKLIQRIIEMSTEEGDLVLDYHLGSGTTTAVAHKLNRRYIGIEQIDYGNNDSVVRLKNVINGDQSGISKTVGWQGGGSFVYCELAEWNAVLVKEILAVHNKKGIVAMLKKLQSMPWRAFINYTASPEFVFDETKTNEYGKRFIDLPVEEQKQLLVALLDKNFLYVNLTELDAPEMRFDETTRRFNRSFYSGHI